MEINVELFLQTLPIMLKGMVGIFAVTGVIILGIYLLNKLSAVSLKRKRTTPSRKNNLFKNSARSKKNGRFLLSKNRLKPVGFKRLFYKL